MFTKRHKESKSYYIPRRNTIFWSIVICIFFALFIGIVLIWNYLWNFLTEYEKYNVDYVVESYLDLYRNKEYDKLLDYEKIDYSEFNDKNAYINYLKTHVDAETTSDYKALKAEKKGDTVIYNIYNGNKRISKIIVSPNGIYNKYNMQGWDIDSENEYKKDYSIKIFVPSNASLVLDGKQVEDSYLSSETQTIEDYDQLNDKNLIPKLKCYEVKDLLNSPKITVLNSEGKELNVYNQNGTFYANEIITDDFMNAIKERTEMIAVKYALYSILDLKFEDIKPFFYENTEYYKKIQDFKNDWYLKHTFSYDNVSFGDIIQYDSEHVVVNISFTYHVNIGYKVIDYDAQYKMSMIKDGADWKVAQMKLK